MRKKRGEVTENHSPFIEMEVKVPVIIIRSRQVQTGVKGWDPVGGLGFKDGFYARLPHKIEKISRHDERVSFYHWR